MEASSKGGTGKHTRLYSWKQTTHMKFSYMFCRLDNILLFQVDVRSFAIKIGVNTQKRILGIIHLHQNFVGHMKGAIRCGYIARPLQCSVFHEH